METIELKFLLKLLAFENYRASLSEISLDSNLSTVEREEICRNLYERGFVACSYEISKFKIAPPGKFLLKQDLNNLPLTQQEIKVLRASAKGKITPKEIEIPAPEQQAVIQSLAERGLIQVKEKHKKIKDVWLTERGKEYLQYEYTPNQSAAIIRLDLLTNYLLFLRKSFQETCVPLSRQTQVISDEQILLTIVELERQLNTNNRLPIFYLREKLHPLIPRKELDSALSRLEASGKIELSALQAVAPCAFSSEQINEGIPQNGNAPLFFVILK